MRIKLCALFLPVLALLLGPAAHAQVGVYGKLDLTHLNDNANNSSAWFYGPAAGIYFNFLPLGPIALGADVRGSYEWGSNYDYRSALVGLRLVVRPPALGVRPYVQGSAGVAGTRSSSSASSASQPQFANKFAWEILGGLDFALLPHVDLRLPEIGYGRVSPVLASSGAPLSDTFLLSTGIVLRLP